MGVFAIVGVFGFRTPKLTFCQEEKARQARIFWHSEMAGI